MQERLEKTMLHSQQNVMRYRLATTADAAVLAKMNQRLIQDEHHRNSMTLEQLEERMRGWLGGEYQAMIFEDEAGIAGYGLYRQEPEHVYLRQFYVERNRRRQGIGRVAIAWLMEHAWKEVKRVRLEVLVENRAGAAFWRAVGFGEYCVTMEREVV